MTATAANAAENTMSATKCGVISGPKRCASSTAAKRPKAKRAILRAQRAA
jgi:hypothetical protein